MYLYLYLREKFVGTVDLDVYFDVQNAKIIVACTPDCTDLLRGLELAYGKTITSISRAEAWDVKHGHFRPTGWKQAMVMPAHVFTTKNCGPFLKWEEYERALACKV